MHKQYRLLFISIEKDKKHKTLKRTNVNADPNAQLGLVAELGHDFSLSATSYFVLRFLLFIGHLGLAAELGFYFY